MRLMVASPFLLFVAPKYKHGKRSFYKLERITLSNNNVNNNETENFTSLLRIKRRIGVIQSSPPPSPVPSQQSISESKKYNVRIREVQRMQRCEVWSLYREMVEQQISIDGYTISAMLKLADSLSVLDILLLGDFYRVKMNRYIYFAAIKSLRGLMPLNGCVDDDFGAQLSGIIANLNINFDRMSVLGHQSEYAYNVLKRDEVLLARVLYDIVSKDDQNLNLSSPSSSSSNNIHIAYLELLLEQNRLDLAYEFIEEISQCLDDDDLEKLCWLLLRQCDDFGNATIASNVFIKLNEFQLVDSFHLNSYLHTLMKAGEEDKALQILSDFSDVADTISYNAILSSIQDYSKAMSFFHDIPNPNIITYHHLLRLTPVENFMELLNEMENNQVQPNAQTFVIALKELSLQAPGFDDAEQIYFALDMTSKLYYGAADTDDFNFIVKSAVLSCLSKILALVRDINFIDSVVLDEVERIAMNCIDIDAYTSLLSFLIVCPSPKVLSALPAVLTTDFKIWTMKLELASVLPSYLQEEFLQSHCAPEEIEVVKLPPLIRYSCSLLHSNYEETFERYIETLVADYLNSYMILSKSQSFKLLQSALDFPDLVLYIFQNDGDKTIGHYELVFVSLKLAADRVYEQEQQRLQRKDELEGHKNNYESRDLTYFEYTIQLWNRLRDDESVPTPSTKVISLILHVCASYGQYNTAISLYNRYFDITNSYCLHAALRSCIRSCAWLEALTIFTNTLYSDEGNLRASKSINFTTINTLAIVLVEIGGQEELGCSIYSQLQDLGYVNHWKLDSDISTKEVIDLHNFSAPLAQVAIITIFESLLTTIPQFDKNEDLIIIVGRSRKKIPILKAVILNLLEDRFKVKCVVPKRNSGRIVISSSELISFIERRKNLGNAK